MNKKEFINRRNAIKEDFRVRVDKEGDALSVEAEGENSQEFFDFARCLFGDNFDSFNCDFSDPVQPEQQVEVEIPEVGFDYKAEDPIADVEDPFTVFDDAPIEPPEEVHVGETTEEAKEEETEVEYPEEEEEEEEDSEEEAEEDHKYENQPMDMINGKLVPAKDPTAPEVEIDDEDDDDDEEDEEEEELEEDLKEREYECYYKDDYVGSVYAKSEEEAYEKMEKEWPWLHYGEYDGVAYVAPVEDSEDDFVNAFGEAFYGKKKDLKKAKTVEKKDLKADVAQASEEVSLKEEYEPQSEEEKALWDKLADNGCGPNFEYELLYDATEFDNRVTRSFEKVTYDGDFVPSDSYLVGYYDDEVFYYKTPTHEDVLEFLGEDHLTAEGAERFIADSKKKDPKFVNFLNDKYVEEAADKFQDDLEDGKYDEFISNWDEEWPDPPDYDEYDYNLDDRN